MEFKAGYRHTIFEARSLEYEALWIEYGIEWIFVVILANVLCMGVGMGSGTRGASRVILHDPRKLIPQTHHRDIVQASYQRSKLRVDDSPTGYTLTSVRIPPSCGERWFNDERREALWGGTELQV